MQLIRVLTFAPLPPTVTGGIEEYAYAVIAEMRAQGLDVRVVTSRFKNRKFPSESSGYISISSFMCFQRPIPLNPFVFVKVAKAIRSSDIVHIHMPYPILESFAAIISKLSKKKIIVTYHMDSKIDSESKSAARSFFFSLIEKAYRWVSARWALKFCDVICTNTKAYALNSPVLTKYLSKVTVMYQGIRKDLYNFLDESTAQKMRAQYLAQGYSYIVTFVGRLVGYKGLPYLLEAIHLLRNDKTLFIIGGEGPQKQYLMNLATSYGLKNVIFTGRVKDEDLFNLFAASDLVVSPSISELESTPISLLSALSVGTPVIGTSIGGTAETIPNDGVHAKIIPIKDSQALANAIISMLEARNKNKFKSTTRFWERVAKDYIQIMYRITRGANKREKVQSLILSPPSY